EGQGPRAMRGHGDRWPHPGPDLDSPAGALRRRGSIRSRHRSGGAAFGSRAHRPGSGGARRGLRRGAGDVPGADDRGVRDAETARRLAARPRAGGGRKMIRMEGVRKAFGGRPVLDGVDVEIPAGCLWGLIGPGAAGKSLLAKLLVGLVRADAGRIFVGDDEVSALGEDDLMRVRERFGMLFQNNALFDFMTVERNVAFPLVRAGVAENEALSRAHERL